MERALARGPARGFPVATVRRRLALREWDVAFKLHAPNDTVVAGTYRNGTLETLAVRPPHRRADVELMFQCGSSGVPSRPREGQGKRPWPPGTTTPAPAEQQPSVSGIFTARLARRSVTSELEILI